MRHMGTSRKEYDFSQKILVCSHLITLMIHTVLLFVTFLNILMFIF